MLPAPLVQPIWNSCIRHCEPSPISCLWSLHWSLDELAAGWSERLTVMETKRLT